MQAKREREIERLRERKRYITINIFYEFLNSLEVALVSQKTASRDFGRRRRRRTGREDFFLLPVMWRMCVERQKVVVCVFRLKTHIVHKNKGRASTWNPLLGQPARLSC